jgi:hypothetical protein
MRQQTEFEEVLVVSGIVSKEKGQEPADLHF